MGRGGGRVTRRLMPINRKVIAIIRREYLQRVRSRWFLIATFGLPLLFIGVGVVAGVLAMRAESASGATQSIGVVDRTGRIADFLVEELLRDSLLATPLAVPAPTSDEELPARLLESDYTIYLVLPADAVDSHEVDVDLYAKENVPAGRRRTIREAVNRSLVRARLAGAGIEGVDPDALLAKASLGVVNVTEEGGARSQEVAQAISFAITIIFYMVLIFYGQMIVRSVIEEKSSDIVEVMVSSVRPWELMLGKIVGVGAVGLTQMAIWGLVIAGFGVYGLTAGAAALAESGVDLGALGIPVSTIVGVALFLLFGYLLYAGLFAGAGATVSSEHDAQHALLPVIILIIVPFVAAQGVIENPNAGLSVALSLVPFFSPLLMPSRMMVTAVPAWEVGSALLLLVVFILLAAWVAGRIYRVGILMKGKRPNLPELVRWVRHG